MKMKNVLIGTLMLFVLFFCIGCSKEEMADNNSRVTPDRLPTKSDGDINEGNPTIFDFSDLIEDDFPRGNWTINELINEYGHPDEIIGTNLFANGGVLVRAGFADKRVHFVREPMSSFSFYEDTEEGGDYALNEYDRNIILNIAALQVYGADAQFPYGIRIGTSKKSQIVASYNEESAYRNQSDEYDKIIYKYAFYDEKGALHSEIDERDIGSITYFFDGNEVLSSADIRWFFYDVI